jgi:hypothetical protein
MSREPRFARWLVERVAGPFERDVTLGDFAEEFAALDQAEGRAAARRWYRRQAMRSLLRCCEPGWPRRVPQRRRRR